MDDIENYFFRLSRSQGMSYLRASRGYYDALSISRRVSLSSRPYVATPLIRMIPDCVL